jgi:hypothetical protein
MWQVLALQAVGGLMNASAQLNQGKMDHELANYNARLSEAEAEDTLEKGFRDEQNLRRDYEYFRGDQEVAIAKSGVAFSGSVLDVLADGSARAELDAMNIKYAAQQRSTALKEDARVGRIRGDAARTQSRSAAMGSAIGTAANMYTSSYMMR